MEFCKWIWYIITRLQKVWANLNTKVSSLIRKEFLILFRTRMTHALFTEVSIWIWAHKSIRLKTSTSITWFSRTTTFNRRWNIKNHNKLFKNYKISTIKKLLQNRKISLHGLQEVISSSDLNPENPLFLKRGG